MSPSGATTAIAGDGTGQPPMRSTDFIERANVNPEWCRPGKMSAQSRELSIAQIEKTELPGHGVRYDFITSENQRIGVIHSRTGRRDLFVCPPEDPDLVAVTVHLNEEEAHNLIDMLGGSQVVADMNHLQQQVEGPRHRLAAGPRRSLRRRSDDRRSASANPHGGFDRRRPS